MVTLPQTTSPSNLGTLTKPVPQPSNPYGTHVDVGAVVIGGDYQGLGIVRSLGRHGIPTCVVDDEHSISRFSRFATQFVKLPSLRDGDSTVDVLLKLGERLRLHGWVLYPTRDEHVGAFSKRRSDLSKVFRVPTPDWERVQWAWDKRNTYRLARDLGIPTPWTVTCESVEGLSQLDREDPPFAIKPAIKEKFIYATKAKAWCAASHSELRVLFQRASELISPSEAMIQEVIPGGGSQQYSYCAFFANGEAIGKMVARRRRQHPLLFGRASTYVETIDAPLLEELSERLLRAIDYYGLAELEYKLDPRDGRYKLLDFNARTWGYHSLGLQTGVDFSYMLYAHEVGLPVDRCQAPPGIGWVRMTTDVPTAFMAWRGGDLNLTDYVNSLRTCVKDAVYSFGDPLPGLAELILIPYLAVKRGF